MVVHLHEHQKKAVEKLSNGKILLGDVGTGKTITSLAYYVTQVCGGEINKWGSMTTPRDLIVITTAKKRDSKDWQKDARLLGIGEDRDLTQSGVTITVDSWNNIEKYTGVADAFFIFDEQRVVGYGAWSKAFISIARRNQWILLSATPGDVWLDYAPVFIANGFYRNITHFKNDHAVYTTYGGYPKIERYVNTGVLLKYRHRVLVEMPFERHTKRFIHRVVVEYDETLFERVFKKRWHVYEGRPLRDAAEMFSVMRKVVNSDLSRLRAVESLMNSHPRLIVFYNFDYELELLRTLGSVSTQQSSTPPKASPSSSPGPRSKADLLAAKPKLRFEEITPGSPSTRSGKTSEATSEPKQNAGSGSQEPASMTTELTVAEWNGHKHQEVPTTDRWVYLVQYTAGSEGWNCITTNAMVFYSQTYSYKAKHQGMGRIDRLNTLYTDLHYYELLTNSFIDKAISASLRAKKSFNQSAFIKKRPEMAF